MKDDASKPDIKYPTGVSGKMQCATDITSRTPAAPGCATGRMRWPVGWSLLVDACCGVRCSCFGAEQAVATETVRLPPETPGSGQTSAHFVLG